MQKANIYSKTSGMLEPRPRAWPYETLGFGYLYHLIDGTVNRFNANTKMVVVDGPPGKLTFVVLSTGVFRFFWGERRSSEL